MAFTNPCNECDKEAPEQCNSFRDCRRYHYWLNYCWKCARVAAKSAMRAEKSETKFVYHHPDEVRRYIKDGVCSKCPLNGNCDEPCGAYWDWWDTRMEYFRKVFEVCEN